MHGQTALWIAIHGVVYLELSAGVELFSKLPVPHPEALYISLLQAGPMKDDRFR